MKKAPVTGTAAYSKDKLSGDWKRVSRGGSTLIAKPNIMQSGQGTINIFNEQIRKTNQLIVKKHE